MFDDLFAQLSTQLVENQEYLVVIISSWALAFAAKQWPGFGDLGNWTKRAALFASATAVTAAVLFVGGEATMDLGAIVIGGGAATAAAGTVFKIARTTPTTSEAAKAMKETK